MGRKSIFGFLGTSFGTKHWLTLDNCGLVCITFSFSVLIFAIYEVHKLFISDDKFATVVFFVVYFPCTILALASLFMAWITNPGAVPMGAKPLLADIDLESGKNKKSKNQMKVKRGIRRCRKCNDNFKPPRAHHDSVTGRCVVKMDHFCPWVCNAVGALNHKFFFLFVLYTFITCVTCLLLIFVRFIQCGSVPSQNDANSNDDTISNKNSFVQYVSYFLVEETAFLEPKQYCNDIYSPAVLTLFILAILFMIFTSCMLFDQVDAIKNNISKIARMKLKQGNGNIQTNSELARVATEFNEVFGGNSTKFAWHWLLPIPVRFPPGMHDQVMGYEWDSSFPNEPYRPTSTKVMTVATKCDQNEKDVTIESSGDKSEKSQSFCNPLETSQVNDAPFLSSDAGVKRRNTKQEEEEVALLQSQES